MAEVKSVQEPKTVKMSGYRIYSEEDLQRLEFIKRTQDLGFTLKEIDYLLGVVDVDESRCQNVFEFTSEKIIEIDKKIQYLIRMKDLLSDLKNRCPIIESLEHTKEG